MIEAGTQARPLLQAVGLNKVYVSQNGQKTVALEGVSLDIAAGEFVSIVGPSGCGKSTLLSIVSGLSRPSSGQVLIGGKPKLEPGGDIGMIFQEPLLLPYRTVLENVLLPARILRLPLEPARGRAHDLLRLVGLEGFSDRYPHELSGGMQQRAAIARGLLHDPAILLMDEPFGALDAMTREQMNFELLDIWKASSKTILFITHSVPEAVFLSDRVVVMSPRPGRIIDMLDIDLARPRTLKMQTSARYGELMMRIRLGLGVRGAEA